jgi:hypothetical protein
MGYFEVLSVDRRTVGFANAHISEIGMWGHPELYLVSKIRQRESAMKATASIDATSSVVGRKGNFERHGVEEQISPLRRSPKARTASVEMTG